MKFSASSENIHDVTKVKVTGRNPENSNSVSFDIETETGWKRMTLFFANQPENAEAFYNALSEMDEKHDK